MPRFQFRLGTLLAVVTVVAVLGGWYADHARLVRENERLATRNREMKLQAISRQYEFHAMETSLQMWKKAAASRPSVEPRE